jgi:hypothetical protein
MGMLGIVSKALEEGRKKIRAYHGSPHDFDRFSTDNIGTGEGAQAYGHGLYFAEREGTAQSYKSSTNYADKKRQFQNELPDDAYIDEVVEMKDEGAFSPEMTELISALEENDFLGFDYPSQAISAAFRNLTDYDASPRLKKAVDSGHMYEVNINASPDELLDYDLPLSEQSDFVKSRLPQELLDREGARGINAVKDFPIPNSEMMSNADYSQKATEALQESGIKGIKYADAQTRFSPKGKTHNYVVFDDKLVEIARKYGVTLPVASAILAGTMTPEQAQAGFFSQAVKAAQNLQRKTGNAQGFKNDLTGKGQVKPDELKAMGFDEHFGDRKDITKEEVQQFINENQVQIKETLLSNAEGYRRGTKFGEYTLPGGDNYRELLLQKVNTSAKRRHPDQDELDELNSLAMSEGIAKELKDQESKLKKQKTEIRQKLKEYRQKKEAPPQELLVESGRLSMKITELDDKIDNAVANHNSRVSFLDNKIRTDDSSLEASQTYQSGHFKEPNVLAHLRMKDRVDVDGNKTLLIEEAQSDWHQKGDDVGYRPSQKQIDKLREKRDLLAAKQKELDLEDADYLTNNPNEHRSPDEFMDRSSDNYKALLNAQFNLDTALEIDKVPDAPFKTEDKSSWYNLAMKRGLIEAAEGDYDKLAITTGRQQAERYDLSHQISEIQLREEVIPNNKASGGDPLGERKVYLLDAYNLDYDKVINKRLTDPEKELPDIVGREVAKKLLNQDAKKVFPHKPWSKSNIKTLNNVDLKVGGEGMEEFYDRKLPNTLNKLVKQDGVKVGQSDILRQTPLSESTEKLMEADGWFTPNDNSTVPKDTVHSMDITPEMRDRVNKGLPLFAQGGLAVGGGALFAPKDLQAAEYNEAPVIEEQSFGDMVNEYGQINRNLKALDDRRFARLMDEEKKLRAMGSASFGKVSPELAAYRRSQALPSLAEMGMGALDASVDTLDFLSNLPRAAATMQYQGNTPLRNKLGGVLDTNFVDERDEHAIKSNRFFGSLFSPL